MQALIAIENTVTVSTDYEIFWFAGVVIYIYVFFFKWIYKFLILLILKG